MHARPWLLVLLLVVVVGAVAFLRLRPGEKDAPAAEAHAEPARQPPRAVALPAPERRTQALVKLAPVPVPTALPLRGGDGVDDDGYPVAAVDRAALRSLLWHRRYQELTRAFAELQGDFEADAKREYWPMDAGDAFASAEPELRDRLDAWVAATPDSFAPYLARGTYWVAVGFARRGGRFTEDTTHDEMAALR
jgi:hypothetical protein